MAQAFLGDLGVVDTSDTHCVRVAGELFLVRFRTAAEALKSVTVVAVDRATGATRFVDLEATEESASDECVGMNWVRETYG